MGTRDLRDEARRRWHAGVADTGTGASRALRALDLLDDIVLETDPRGRICFLNRAGRLQLGISPRQLRAGPELATFLRDGQGPPLPEVLQRLVADGGAGFATSEGGVVTADGTVRVIAWRHRVTRADDGSVAGVLSCGQDVTDRRRREDRFRDGERLQAMGRLAAGIAHDFNNQLTLIRSYLRTIGDHPGSPRAGEALARGERVAAGAQTTVSRLLAFSRERTDGPERIDPRELLTGLQETLLRLLGAGVRLQVVAPPGLPEVTADRLGLEHAIMNLAINASDASPGGGPLLVRARRASATERRDGGSRRSGAAPEVVLEVVDQGTGMDRATLARAPEPFFTTKAAGEGTGLGLPAAARLVEDCGGWLRLDSEPGRGTTARILLPASGHPAPG